MSELERVRPCSAVEYLSGKPALLFASSWRRRAAAEPALEACGVRLVDSVAISEATARLDEQVSLGLAWLELGIVGLPIIQRLNLATEVKAGKLWTRPSGLPAEPADYNMSGLWIDQKGRERSSPGASARAAPPNGRESRRATGSRDSALGR
jgi:hypothetical protein